MKRLSICLAALTVAACGDDEAVDVADTGSEQQPCTLTLSSGGDDQSTVQRAFIEATADSVICFEEGDYTFTDELSITTRGITLRGLGDGPTLDFIDQTSGASGISVTGDDFTADNLTLLNTPGDSILVQGATNVVFRDLDVSWDAGSVTENGAYAVYPVQCTNVLVEDCEVSGASDAGIYVGQSDNIIVRNNVVYANVAGIEIENSTDAEVYGNHAYDNTAGILVFNLPNLPVMDGRRTRVYDNLVEDNNRANFALAGNIVAAVPVGIGALVLAADEIEFHDNTFSDNNAGGIMVVGWGTFAQLSGGDSAEDPNHDQFSETIWIHENSYSNNGTSPIGVISLLFPALADIVWDDFVDSEKDNSDGSLSLCIREESATFLNADGPGGFADQSNDVSEHLCEHDSLDPVELSL